MIRTLAIATITVSLLAAGCGDDDDDATSASGDTPTTTAAAETTTTQGDATTTSAAAGGGDAADADLALASSDFGDVLVDSGGFTLYVFTPDAKGDSTCEGDCASRWPPAPELSTVGEGLDEGLLGTTTRADGEVQATYNGWPLYRFAPDTAPGDVNGQGVGDVWFVVDASGEPVMEAA